MSLFLLVALEMLTFQVCFCRHQCFLHTLNIGGAGRSCTGIDSGHDVQQQVRVNRWDRGDEN